MMKILASLLIAVFLSVPAHADWFSTPVNGDNTTIEKSAGKLRVKDGGISAAKLATNSVTTIKIDDLDVTTAKINDLAVTTGKLADQAATAAKVSTIVGADVARSNNTIYQAATDGEFCGVVTCGTSSINVGKIIFQTDAATPPTVVKTAANCQVHADTIAETTTSNIGGACVSVRKNDYYRGILTSTAAGGGSTGATASYTFTALGS